MKLTLRRRRTYAKIIRNAVNSYPGGLAFAMPDGRVILSNHAMNELSSRLTGHAVVNVYSTWEELREANPMTIPKIEGEPEEPDDSTSEKLFFRIGTSEIWQIRKTEEEFDEGRFLQLTADDITERYSLGKQIYDNHARLTGLRERQRTLLKNILQINTDKELLQAKMRVHDDFGRCLIATGQALENPDGTDLQVLTNAWEDAIMSLSATAGLSNRIEKSQKDELLKAAGMIGCRMEFLGVTPNSPLFYAAVREALTNAVRHANADCLTVETVEQDGIYRVRITANGTAPTEPITEGSGLSNLRMRLENEGGSLTIEYQPGVVLCAEIPVAQ